MMDPITIAMGLASLVPDIVKWVGGSDNSVQAAQKVVDIAQKVTGTASGDDALQAVRDNPTLALQLQQELDKNQQELAKISQAVTLAEIQADTANYAKEVEDRESARQMQISTRSRTAPLLAVLITLGFFGILSFMLFKEVPNGQKDVLNIMLGSLGTAWVTVVSFYFGSSKSSEDKTVMLANSVPIQPGQVAVQK